MTLILVFYSDTLIISTNKMKSNSLQYFVRYVLYSIFVLNEINELPVYSAFYQLMRMSNTTKNYIPEYTRILGLLLIILFRITIIDLTIS